MDKKYNVVIIGGGPAGYEAAFEGTKRGLSIGIIENDNIGGTCLNYGCVPIKSILHSAHEKEVCLDKIETIKNAVVKDLRQGLEMRINKENIDVIKGDCQILSDSEIKVNEEIIAFDYLIIATGAEPIIPKIKGLDSPGVFTSKDLLEKFNKPFKSITIIGGGVIGMEFATIYNSLGIQVTVVEAKKNILPDFDKEISQNLKMILKKRDVNIYTSRTVEKIINTKDGIECVLSNDEENIKSEAVLLSVGRKANLEVLKNSKILIETDNGHIKINDNFQTNIPNIYAIGDVAGGIQLAHVASAMGRNAISAIIGIDSIVDMKTIPSCVYTNPEIATVGVSEGYAKENNLNYKANKYPMSANGKSLIDGMDRGFIKVITEKETGKILGAQIMSGRATEMIMEMALAIRLGATLDDIGNTIHPHPTYSEGFYELAKK